MSGIVGVWNLDGRPLDPDVLARMSSALRHRGPDGEGREVLGSIGFAHQHLWVTPEEQGEVQPVSGRAGIMLALDGRLDNRAELLPALRLPRETSDARCVLAAYDAWEDHVAEHLSGDFAFAIFDGPKRRLLLARDAIGIRPLYYFHSDRLLAFASEIKALLAHPHVPAQPDNEGLADYLVVGCRPVDRQQLTCFANISALVPAHIAVVRPERLMTRRYWDFAIDRPLRLQSLDEYVDAFRERFAEAIRRRLRSASPVAVSVSGGLDSSSIFCQGERLRQTTAGQYPEIVAISYVGTVGTDADEREYLVDLERQYGPIDRFPIDALLGPIQGAEEQILAIEAPFVDYMWGVTQQLYRRAAGRGARTLLSGHWGDQVLFSSAYLTDLVHSFAWRSVCRHLSEYRRWIQPGEARERTRRFVFELVRNHVPDSLIPPLKWIRRRLMRSRASQPWFSDAFLKPALKLADRPAKFGASFHSLHGRSIYLEARSKYHVQCMEWNNKAGSQHGMDAAFPFLDRDLLAFLIAVPGDVQNWNGVPRALLREAMRGILPDSVRARAWKADFSGAVNRGVARDLPAINRALSAQSLSARYGYLDSLRFAAELPRLSAGLSRADCLDSWALADLFGLEVWLQVFFGRLSRSGPEFRRTPHECEEGPTETHEKATLPHTPAHHSRGFAQLDPG
jgi:asparagine synthase (glutamine-hydrolysing)